MTSATGLPYRSFWMGGFEGADHINSHGVALDMAASSGHLERLDEDYAAAAALGMRTVRESIGWRLAEPAPGRFDLQRLVLMQQAANDHGVQILWSLMHYGTPPDVSLFDDALIERFTAFAVQVARVLAPMSDAPVVTPINEIGFLAWAASETSLITPYRNHPQPGPGGGPRNDSSLRSGYAVKRRLVRATLAAMQAMREVDPRTRFLQIEPLVHAVAPPAYCDPDALASVDERSRLDALAAQIAGYQWQVWDLLSGRLERELGGSDSALDLIGVNHYATSQWEVHSEARLPWLTFDPRRRPPSRLFADAWQRYGKPLMVAETSDVGEARPRWLEHIASEVALARAEGTPVGGICLYPLVDRPDWERPSQWHRSGVFDVVPPSPAQPAQPASAGDACPDAPLPAPPHVFNRIPHPSTVSALQRWQAVLPQPTESSMPTLIVFSHLRWGFVYQRPQQLMSRLAKNHRVVFIEEPVRAEGPPRLQRTAPVPGVEVLTPHTPHEAFGFHDDQLPALGALIDAFVLEEDIRNPIVWFYTPMALPLAAALKPATLVYDCMDELAAFKGAPRQLRQRELALIKAADLLLTGGPSLYEARRDMHANAHCLPSAVDGAHFTPARLLPDSREAHDAGALHAAIGTPRLGFFGVIDERMDLALIASLAEARPQWQWVMAGPVVKIDPASLPQRPNLHWLGMQPYAVLPYLAAQWDVCLMPFALNESTRFISPTKTLEYMAAEKPIVSTAVHDVGVLYGDNVHIAHDVPGFLAGCEQALAETPAVRAQRVAAMLATVWRMSWDNTVATIETLLAESQRAADDRESAAAVRAGSDAGAFRASDAMPVVASRLAGAA